MRGGASPAGEALAREERLRRRSDYTRCYREGRRRQGALAIVYAAPNPLRHPRLGITVTRKVGSAVVRNRLKRRVREIYRRWPERSTLPPLDLVVHLRPEARGAGFHELREELLRLLASLRSRSRAG